MQSIRILQAVRTNVLTKRAAEAIYWRIPSVQQALSLHQKWAGNLSNIILEFVDTTMSGEYRLTMDPSEKDALLYVPGAGLTMAEQMGLSDKTARFTRTDGTHLGTGSMPLPESMNEFTRIEQYAKIFRPPAIKYKDLEAVVNSNHQVQPAADESAGGLYSEVDGFLGADASY